MAVEFKMWDKRYQVGSDGSVWSLDYNHTGKIKQMKTHLNKDGYPCVYLSYNNKRFESPVHRMVALRFLDRPNPRFVVNHKNGIRIDSRAENLEWISNKDNVIHGWQVNKRQVSQKHREVHRKMFSGANNPKAYITQSLVNFVLELRHEYKLGLVDVEEVTGVSKSQVSNICRGKQYLVPHV